LSSIAATVARRELTAPRQELTAARGRADDSDIKTAFDSLSQTYLTVKGEVDRSHNEWTQQSWRSVHARMPSTT